MKKDGSKVLKIGDVIDGKYRVLHKVGKGGMSRVYLALNEAANKQWAVKEVRKDGSLNGEMIRQNLMTETKLLIRLENEHLPSIIDVIDQDDTYMIIMDYIEGGNLKKLMEEKGAQPQERVVDWGIQVCDALEYLHGQDPKIIYRDLKPANLMLKPDGTIVIIDFGIAREYKSGQEKDTVCLGTKGYAAPEQYLGSDLGQTDERTDIYNLGATLYELVTGHDPSKKPYRMKPIREWDPSLSSGLEAVIAKCTREDPDDRFQSAAELRYALQHYRRLDIKNQIIQKKKARRFCISLMAAGILMMTSSGCSYYAASLRNETYESYMSQAMMAEGKDKKEELYMTAIDTDPERADAYNTLLDEVFLVDGIFAQDEADTITYILGSADGNASSNKFKENRKDYDQFAYNMGLAYFYYFEGNGNKQMSRPWLSQVKDSKYLSLSQKKRTGVLCRISEYYAQLNNTNKAGDSTISYMDYWNDLDSLTEGDIASEDNIKTALVTYKEYTYQIAVHCSNFKKAGVTREAMEEAVEKIREKTDAIKGMTEYDDEMYGQFMDDVENNLNTGESSINRNFH